MYYSLYKYDNYIGLLYQNKTVSTCPQLDNRPMTSNNIKLYKGVDNVVKFKVYDPDRKLISIDDLEVEATFIDVTTKERVLKKECDMTNKKGIMELTVYEEDLINIAPSFYTLSIVGKNYDVPEQDAPVSRTPFYTDTAANIQLTVEVLDSVDKTPIDTIEVFENDWVREEVGANLEPTFSCGPFPATRLKNYKNGTHTIAVYGDNYTGTFKAFGTLEIVPPQDTNLYFPLNLTNLMTDVRYTEFTGIDPFTFQANIMWIKFVHTPDPALTQEQQGKITKLQFRS